MTTHEITLAHSPDADDVYMWWPITGMVDPADHTRVVEQPEIDTGRFRFRAVPADISVLNRRAAEAGDLDITALSAFALAAVGDRYAATACGWSVGDGYGPKVVCRAGCDGEALVTLAEMRRADWCGKVATPGVRTTAFGVFRMLLGRDIEAVEMPFGEIVGAVRDGDVDAGLLIHEAQLTYRDDLLSEVVDLGAWWKSDVGAMGGGVLPLGVNAVKRDLDARFGEGSSKEIAGILARSIEHAHKERRRSLEYARGFAPGVPAELLERFVGMYVNSWTEDCGEAGEQALGELLRRGAALGLCDPVGEVVIVRPA